MKYKIALFGTTGFGSQLLQYLIDLGHEIFHVFTRKEEFHHPYFPVESINDIAERYGIPYSYTMPDYIDDDIDLVLCSTYNKILPETILSIPGIGAFNFHPSLLPAYKGPTPTKQTLLNGEAITGLSLHKIQHNFDTRNVITQYPLDIDDFYDDGLLRQRLSELQYPVLLDLFKYLHSPEGFPKTLSGIQDSSFLTPFHELHIELNEKTSILKLSRQLRASSPFPGLRLKYNEKYYELKKFIEFSNGHFEFKFKETGIISIYGHDVVLSCVGNTI